MLCCETKYGDPTCRKSLMKFRQWYVCPSDHGRCVPADVVEMKITTARKSTSQQWKERLPAADRRGVATSAHERVTIYGIGGTPYETNWLDVVDSPDVQLENGEKLAAVNNGCIYVRRFRPVTWLTDRQKQRLGF